MEPSNQLKIDSLTEEWVDKDFILLHACFQLLKDFVEKEDVDHRQNDWSFNEDQAAAKVEIDYLYKWWISYSRSAWRGDSKEYEIENEMLIRLVNIRKFLWT